jgi:hypothetical protein
MLGKTPGKKGTHKLVLVMSIRENTYFIILSHCFIINILIKAYCFLFDLPPSYNFC